MIQDLFALSDSSFNKGVGKHFTQCPRVRLGSHGEPGTRGIGATELYVLLACARAPMSFGLACQKSLGKAWDMDTEETRSFSPRFSTGKNVRRHWSQGNGEQVAGPAR